MGRPKPESCEACGGVERGVVFDHCHSTGRARGWLCGPCNLALGLVKDAPARLRALAEYVENFQRDQAVKRDYLWQRTIKAINSNAMKKDATRIF